MEYCWLHFFVFTFASDDQMLAARCNLPLVLDATCLAARFISPVVLDVIFLNALFIFAVLPCLISQPLAQETKIENSKRARVAIPAHCPGPAASRWCLPLRLGRWLRLRCKFLALQRAEALSFAAIPWTFSFLVSTPFRTRFICLSALLVPCLSTSNRGSRVQTCRS